MIYCDYQRVLRGHRVNSSPIIIIIPRQALAHRAKGRPKYKKSLAEQARSDITVAPLTSARLYSKVYYFHRDKRTVDTDNLSKPILDALQGIAYRDDSQVVLRTAAKIDLKVDTYELIQERIASNQYEKLIGLIASAPDVLYIEVGELASFRLSLGVI